MVIMNSHMQRHHATLPRTSVLDSFHVACCTEMLVSSWLLPAQVETHPRHKHAHRSTHALCVEVRGDQQRPQEQSYRGPWPRQTPMPCVKRPMPAQQWATAVRTQKGPSDKNATAIDTSEIPCSAQSPRKTHPSNMPHEHPAGCSETHHALKDDHSTHRQKEHQGERLTTSEVVPWVLSRCQDYKPIVTCLFIHSAQPHNSLPSRTLSPPSRVDVQPLACIPDPTAAT